MFLSNLIPVFFFFFFLINDVLEFDDYTSWSRLTEEIGAAQGFNKQTREQTACWSL